MQTGGKFMNLLKKKQQFITIDFHCKYQSHSIRLPNCSERLEGGGEDRGNVDFGRKWKAIAIRCHLFKYKFAKIFDRSGSDEEFAITLSDF